MWLSRGLARCPLALRLEVVLYGSLLLTVPARFCLPAPVSPLPSFCCDVASFSSYRFALPTKRDFFLGSLSHPEFVPPSSSSYSYACLFPFLASLSVPSPSQHQRITHLSFGENKSYPLSPPLTSHFLSRLLLKYPCLSRLA